MTLLSEFCFRLEMTDGQSQRQVEADSFVQHGDWLIFHRRGEEYWRANLSKVVSMETRRNARAAIPQEQTT